MSYAVNITINGIEARLVYQNSTTVLQVTRLSEDANNADLGRALRYLNSLKGDFTPYAYVMKNIVYQGLSLSDIYYAREASIAKDTLSVIDQAIIQNTFAFEPYQQDIINKWVTGLNAIIAGESLTTHDLSMYTSKTPRAKDVSKQHKYDKPGYIYLVQAIHPSNIYKIGFSGEPVDRVDAMGVLLPFPIEPIHHIKTNSMYIVEKYIHKQYARKRLKGEWFELTEQDVADICAIETLNAEDIA